MSISIKYNYDPEMDWQTLIPEIDVDDLSCMFDQIIAIINGWAWTFEPEYKEELKGNYYNVVYKWRDNG